MFRVALLCFTLAGCAGLTDDPGPAYQMPKLEPHQMQVPQRTTTNCQRTGPNTMNCESVGR